MKRQQWKVIGLCTVGTIAASIMVIDSGAFYDRFSSIEGMGYLQAGLLELALAITTGVWLLEDRFGLRNLVIKLLMLSLFSLSIASATLQVALPEIDTLSHLFNENQAMKLIKSGIKESEKSREWLKKNQQKVNVIIADKRVNHDRKQLTELLLNQKSQLSTWLKIGSLLLVKILLQSSNLMLFYLAGRLSRKPPSKELDLLQSSKMEEPFQTCGVVSSESSNTLEKSPTLEMHVEDNGEMKEHPKPLLSLTELFLNSKLKQSQIASELNIGSSAVSATLRNADKIRIFLKEQNA